MGEPQYLNYPSLSLAQNVFTLASSYASTPNKQTALTALQEGIRTHKMAPLYAYLAHPQTGKLNASGEGGSSAVLSPVLSRQNTANNVSMSSAAGTELLLRRTSSINAPSMVGVLGGKTDLSVELPWDEALYEELKADNERELAAIQKEEEQAVESEGDTEVQSARGKRAEFFARIGDKDRAIEEFEQLLEKTSILGTKIDILLALIRIALFFDDKQLVKKNVERAGVLVESGGDWDRRNRLKAYQGVHLLTIRAYNLAAPLLLDSLSTFTSTELCPYASLVVYATLAGAVALPRRDFKTRVVDAPEIRAVFGSASDPSSSTPSGEHLSALAATAASGPGAQDIDDLTDKASATATPTPSQAQQTAINLTTLATGSASASAQAASEPQLDFRPLASLIRSLYTGNYSTFFLALARTETDFLTPDRYLHEHRTYYIREMRLRAYTQLLQSYKVVSLASMAREFGVGVEWLDRDLATFIAAGRLGASIDRVGGVVETRREGEKNAQFRDVVQRGDALIMKVQKYGQVVRLRGSERG